MFDKIRFIVPIHCYCSYTLRSYSNTIYVENNTKLKIAMLFETVIKLLEIHPSIHLSKPSSKLIKGQVLDLIITIFPASRQTWKAASLKRTVWVWYILSTAGHQRALIWCDPEEPKARATPGHCASSMPRLTVIILVKEGGQGQEWENSSWAEV